MAIPFNLPSDQETENNYRSMDELLLQLYRVLRQILMHRDPVPEPTNDQPRHGRAHHSERRVEEVDAVVPPEQVVPDLVPRLPLPDIVQCNAAAPQATSHPTTTAPTVPVTQSSPRVPSSHPQPPPRRGRRRRLQQRHQNRPSEKEVVEVAAVLQRERKVEVRDNWTQVGEDLRQIADEFRSSLQDLDPKRQPLDSSANQKGFTFLSLLVPAPFRGSVWLAVVFLFGWGVLNRAR